MSRRTKDPRTETMKDPKNYLLVALIAAVAFLLGRGAGPDAYGQGYPGGTADSNNRMIAVTGTIGSGVSVLWAIDTQAMQLAVYQCRGGKTVELVAARKIEFDFKIEEFHDESLYKPEYLRKLLYEGRNEGSSGLKEPGKAIKGSGLSKDGGQEGTGAEER
jgi:hypothetical protein